MRVHFQVSDGVPAAQWVATICGHTEPTMATVGDKERCAMCANPGCVAVAHAVREVDALNHEVTLTVRGEMLHMGEAIIDGVITRSPMETRCSPELLAQIRDLGDLAASEITANLTAGREADGDTLEIEDEPDDLDSHEDADFDRRLDTMESAATRADRGAFDEKP